MIAVIVEMIIGFADLHRQHDGRGKLQETLPQRPIALSGAKYSLAFRYSCSRPLHRQLHWSFHRKQRLVPDHGGVALVFGVMLIMPIGGADMPTVISLFNSYAGLSAARWASCFE